MNRELENILSQNCQYLGSDLHIPSGEEITFWRLPSGDEIKIITIEAEEELETTDNRSDNNESPYGREE